MLRGGEGEGEGEGGGVTDTKGRLLLISCQWVGMIVGGMDCLSSRQTGGDC